MPLGTKIPAIARSGLRVATRSWARRALSGDGQGFGADGRGEDLRRGVSRRTADIRKSFPRRLSRVEMRRDILDGKESGQGDSGTPVDKAFTSHSYGDFLAKRSLSRDTAGRGKNMARTLFREERQDAVREFFENTQRGGKKKILEEEGDMHFVPSNWNEMSDAEKKEHALSQHWSFEQWESAKTK